MSLFKIPQFVLNIISRLEAAGYEAWLVGGCVRDCLLCREPHDWDIASNAAPDTVMSLFEKTVPTGIKYGTVTVLCAEGKAEVTTYRSESGIHRLPPPVKREFWQRYSGRPFAPRFYGKRYGVSP